MKELSDLLYWDSEAVIAFTVGGPIYSALIWEILVTAKECRTQKSKFFVLASLFFVLTIPPALMFRYDYTFGEIGHHFLPLPYGLWIYGFIILILSGIATTYLFKGVQKQKSLI